MRWGCESGLWDKMWTVSEYEGGVCEGGMTVRVDCDNCGEECYMCSWDVPFTVLYLCYFTLFCSPHQIRCRELHVENGQLQEELQRMRRQHGGGGGGGGQRVRQLQEDNEHLRHQVRTYVYVCVVCVLCVYMCVHACLFV